MHRFKTLLALGLLIAVSTSDAYGQRFNTVPAPQLPPGARVLPKQNQTDRQLDLNRLRRPRQAEYRLDYGDTLAVFLEGVLGDLDANPPVQFPEPGSDLPPSVGFPVPVMEDGTISLPQAKRLPVRGLTVRQTEELIRRTFQGGTNPILTEQNRILVTLMRKRTTSVTVVRQDRPVPQQFARPNQPVNARSDRSSRVEVLQLPAGQDDVFNALVRSGGIPGLNAEPNVRVGRSSSYRPNYSNGQFPRSGDGLRNGNGSRARNFAASSNRFSSVPVYVSPQERGRYSGESGTLREGDIVHVDAKPTDVYYTGGLLGGGEFPLPRDTDLDVTQAVALAGGTLATQGNGRFAPSELTVLRRLPGNRQIAIRVDLNRALVDPAQRILVAPGDTLILRHKPIENVGNFGIGVFNNFGIRQLAR